MNAFVPSGIFKRQHHATSVRTPFARMLPRVMGGLSNKIVGSQHYGSVGLGLLLEELTRCSLFNYFAQPHKLIHALIWFYAAPTFKIVHRRGADRAQNYFALIEHRELNDQPIEVVTLDLALLQRHCKCSIPEGFDCVRWTAKKNSEPVTNMWEATVAMPVPSTT